MLSARADPKLQCRALFSDQGSEQFDLLLNEIKKEETGTKTTTQTITAVKENGKWRITADDNLTKALYPGLEEGINSISNILIN